MQKIYPHFEQADMIVLASPVYYLHISGQLQCAITRTYNIGIPKNLKKAALILSSG
nr:MULTISPECIES: NAD(P)H-dependent oxidoreductase [Eubacterium]